MSVTVTLNGRTVPLYAVDGRPLQPGDVREGQKLWFTEATDGRLVVDTRSRKARRAAMAEARRRTKR